MAIYIKVVPPVKLLSLSELTVLARVAKVVGDERDTHHRMYNSATRTWNHSVAWKTPPLRVSAIMVSADITTRDRIFRFVHSGTEVRFATMTRNFKSKTVPGVLASRPGAGRKLYVSRLAPKPGIAARDFTNIIVDRRFPIFVAKVAAAIRASLR